MAFSQRPTAPVIKASKDENVFSGRSMLRADERKREEKAPVNKALVDYLAKNYGGDGEGGHKKKKKKQQKGTDAEQKIKIVDQDVSGFQVVDPKARSLLKRGALAADEDDEDEDSQPLIANPEEAEALRRQVELAKKGGNWVQADSGAGPGPSSRARGRGRSPDASPPRRQQRLRHDGPDASPPRKQARHDSPDASPPRKRAVHHRSPDASPPRRQQAARHDSPDASPPRRQQTARHDSLDASPPRRQQTARHDSPDASPPRWQQAARRNSPDASPPRQQQPARHDSPDASPSRRQQAARYNNLDASPPRRRRAARHDSPEALPLARGGAQGGGQDAAPPRRGPARHDSPDASPPRRREGSPARGSGPAAGSAGVGPPRPPGRSAGVPPRMADGTVSGLVSADKLRQEMEEVRATAQERRRNAEGRGAETVYRDKATGRVLSQDEYLKAKEDERQSKKRKSAYDEDQHLEWRGGLAQKRAAEERAKAAQEEAAKPFARSGPDADHDAALRNAVRFGDPFANLARKKAAATGGDGLLALTQQYDADKLEKSGFKVPQEVPPHSWLKRGVAAPINRNNIRPGRHWDGVDRSNGFEAQMFKFQNQKAARDLEARLWSMGDM